MSEHTISFKGTSLHRYLLRYPDAWEAKEKIPLVIGLHGGAEMSDEEFEQAGGNDSLTHVDFMFGSGEMDVDGLTADGGKEPVMRGGEWAFEIEN